MYWVSGASAIDKSIYADVVKHVVSDIYASYQPVAKLWFFFQFD